MMYLPSYPMHDILSATERNNIAPKFRMDYGQWHTNTETRYMIRYNYDDKRYVVRIFMRLVVPTTMYSRPSTIILLEDQIKDNTLYFVKFNLQ